MPELKAGAILTLDQISTLNFTYKGKDIKFERSESNPNVFTARTYLTQEEKEAGNLDTAFTFNAGVAVGEVSAYQLAPETPEFQKLTDAEKFTKLNSVAFTHNTSEPVDTGDGLDTVLQRPYTTKQPQNQEELNQVLKTQKQEQKKQQQKAKQQIEKQEEEINLSEVKSADEPQGTKKQNE